MPDRSASRSLATRSVRIGLRRTGEGIWAQARPRRACNDSKARVGDLLVPGNIAPWPEVRDTLNKSLRGWSNYFCYGTRRSAFRSVDHYVRERVRAFLVRRHKMAGRGNHRFSFAVLHGERGVLCLERLP